MSYGNPLHGLDSRGDRVEPDGDVPRRPDGEPAVPYTADDLRTQADDQRQPAYPVPELVFEPRAAGIHWEPRYGITLVKVNDGPRWEVQLPDRNAPNGYRVLDDRAPGLAFAKASAQRWLAASLAGPADWPTPVAADLWTRATHIPGVYVTIDAGRQVVLRTPLGDIPVAKPLELASDLDTAAGMAFIFGDGS